MYLLDAHTLIWHKDDDDRLPYSISELLEDPERNQLYISITTWWELLIKETRGGLKLRGGVQGLHSDWSENRAAQNIDVQWNHLKKLREFPDIHRDPFDRMLVAQALVENLTIITRDPHIPKYPGVKTIW
jgi:PIN domain nuclease of toxin-antitoxin system